MSAVHWQKRLTACRVNILQLSKVRRKTAIYISQGKLYYRSIRINVAISSTLFVLSLEMPNLDPIEKARLIDIFLYKIYNSEQRGLKHTTHYSPLWTLNSIGNEFVQFAGSAKSFTMSPQFR